MQLGHALVSLFLDLGDLHQVRDLVDHSPDSGRVVLDHRLLMPLEPQRIQRPPVLPRPADPAPNLFDSKFFGLSRLLFSHGAPPMPLREFHARRPPALR